MFRIELDEVVIDFETLEEAKQFAGQYFTSFGIVLGIEEVKEDVQNH